MRIAITGSTGLAKVLKNTLEYECFDSYRVEQGVLIKEHYDVFINLAHVNYYQTYLLEEWATAWRHQSDKTIINISSRAAFSNVSKGYHYAAEKASLDHLADNLTYNSDYLCKIVTLNLGMMESSRYDSISYEDVADAVKWILERPAHVEINRMTIQHREPYQKVQRKKAYDLNRLKEEMSGRVKRNNGDT